ncbi:phage holin family protein [uncultured Bifidobacterium sp.]|mgnify:CR=1 FL=1|uniref:phage holin family protein n=1 Tax=uncultured Bifidobacterium sp. TaxID=165187 RepID=UPI00259A4BB8|nr:phage holin family protein [uncultured Bifidobacterium sp.]
MDIVWYEILAVIVVSGLDYVTGVVGAIMHGNLSSSQMREGLGHKFAYLVTFFLAWFIDFEMNHIDLGFNAAITPLVTTGIVLIELSSIIENIGEINPELKASKLLQIFQSNRKDNKQ